MVENFGSVLEELIRRKMKEASKRKPFVSFDDIDKLEFMGCTSQEIVNLKKRQGVNYLPPPYEDFLRVMGHYSGDLFIGSNYNYPGILVYKENMIYSLEIEDNPEYQDIFVFMEHQGYVYYYFHTQNMADNPEIFTAYEGRILSLETRLKEYFRSFGKSSKLWKS
jgi:hypothetical protein